jgi:NAD(P)-dependent dehydrogenase (short-subunit alcohol dehydrogenase family)
MLTDKIAIITGGSSGIGTACAHKFAAEGAMVVVADIDDEAGLKVVEDITNHGKRAGYVHTDVTSPKEVDHMIADTVQKYGKLDILMNNVGINPVGTCVETSLEDWDNVMRVNLKSYFLGCKYAIPVMINGGGGSIINTGSVSGIEAGPVSQTAYETSKAGIIALTKSVAQDFGSKNVRANCICPGGTATPLLKSFMEASMTPAEREAWIGIVPMGRLAEPKEIAAVAAFLASDEASYVTGVTIAVDGGRTAGIKKRT